MGRLKDGFSVTQNDITYLLEGEEPIFTGRWFGKRIYGVNCKVTLTAGAYLTFAVRETDRIKLVFEEITELRPPFYACVIDGSEPIRKEISEDEEIILPNKELHIVTIVADGISLDDKKWDKEHGIALAAVDACGGELYGAEQQGKTILFYGDSITEGIRVVSKSIQSDGNSATGAYPWFCTQYLGTKLYNIGHGSAGIGVAGSFATLYDTVDHFSADREYDKTFVPDIIVINHGTNDSKMPSEKFRTEYIHALEKIGATYPGIPIFVMIPFAQTHADDIRMLKNAVSGMQIVETSDWNIKYTDGYHPNRIGSEIAGKRLAEILRPYI